MATEFYNRNWRMPNSWNGSTDNNNKVSNYSMSFDGSSERITVPYNALFDQSLYSISVWIKNDVTTSGDKGILCADSGTRGWALQQNGADLKFDSNISGAGGQVKDTDFFNTTDTWIHCVVTFDGTTSTMYKNGVSAATNTNSNNILNANSNNLTIGDNPQGTKEFAGKLDHVAIFDYALSASQITSLYGNSTDGVGNPMAITGGRKPIAYYPIGDYAAFNGSEYLVNNGALQDYVFDFDTQDYIQYPYISLPGAFTVSTWAKTTDTQAYGNLLSNSNQWGGGGNLNRNFVLTRWNRTARFIAYNSSGTVIFNNDLGVANQGVNTGQSSSDPSLYNGQWNHILAIWDGTTNTGGVKVFINGVLEGLGTASTTAINTDSSVPITAGSSDTNFDFIGEQSNQQIWNTALTYGSASTKGDVAGGEVATIYNNGTPYIGTQPQSSNLKGWWKLDASATFDGSNWSIPDDSSNSNTGTSSGMNAANLVQSDLNITTPYSRYALDFDGTNDNIDINSINLGLNNSISVWYNHPTTPGFNGTLFGNDFAPNDYAIFLSGNNTIYYKIEDATNSSVQTFSTINYNDGNWHNFVFIRTNTTVNLYIDNVLQSVTAPNPLPSNSTIIDKIASKSNNTNYTQATLSNISLWNAALTSTQVTEIYNEGKPGNLNNHSAYSNLVSWWQLGENSSFDGTNWTVLDEKGTNNGTSANMTEADLVNGVGTSANGLSDGMGGADNIIGDAPYSTANAVSYGMGVDALVNLTP